MCQVRFGARTAPSGLALWPSAKLPPGGTFDHRCFTSSFAPCEPHPSALRGGKNPNPSHRICPVAVPERAGSRPKPQHYQRHPAVHIRLTAAKPGEAPTNVLVVCLPGSDPRLPRTQRPGSLPRGIIAVEARAAEAPSWKNAAPSRGPTFTCYANNTKTRQAGLRPPARQRSVTAAKAGSVLTEVPGQRLGRRRSPCGSVPSARCGVRNGACRQKEPSRADARAARR